MEKQRLIHVYAGATSELNRTVNLLSARLGVLKQAEYRQIMEFASEAKMRVRQARADLDAHVAEHGC